MDDYGTIIDHLQKRVNQDQKNFKISIVPAAVQPDFTMDYFSDFKLNFDIPDLSSDDIEITGNLKSQKKKIPADFQFGITGQFSYLLPTHNYLDLVYNYYGISSSESTSPAPITPLLPIGLGGSGDLNGQYHFGEFYFTTRVGLLNILDKYFHNDASLGFSFQNINLHHRNNFGSDRFGLEFLDFDGGTAQLSIPSSQKHKIFSFGPAFKWLSTIDLLSMGARPHNLSFITEVKFALLYAKYYGKGKVAIKGDLTPEDGGGSLDFGLDWRIPTDYFITLNTNLKAGLKYAYKDFCMEFAYKILYFSTQDYSFGNYFGGMLAEGIFPDLGKLFSIVPSTIGFRAFEVSLGYAF